MKNKKLIIILGILVIVFLIILIFFQQNKVIFYYHYVGPNDVVLPNYSVLENGKIVKSENLDGKRNETSRKASKEELEELKRDIEELRDISSEVKTDIHSVTDYFRVSGKAYIVDNKNQSKLNEIIAIYFD